MSSAVLQLTGMIYDAVGDSARWAAFLGAFVRAVEGRHGALALRVGNSPDFSVVCWYGWSDNDIRLHTERYAPIDLWRIGCVRWPEGTVGRDTDVCSREEMESSVAFREFYEPHDAFYGMGGTILVTHHGQSIITALRGASKGPFGESEMAILRHLMPHLKRAALIHGELGSLRRQLATFTEHLNRYPQALFLADAEAKALYGNAAANEVAAARDGLWVENGIITIASSQQNAVFRKAVGDVGANRGARLRRLLVHRPSRREAYRVMLMAVTESGTMPLGVSMPAVTMLVIDPAATAEPDLPVLRELFDLTPAEARVVGKLALGRSVEEIAAETRCSVETVRTHVKRSLAKTQTARQGELISLVLRSIPLRKP